MTTVDTKKSRRKKAIQEELERREAKKPKPLKIFNLRFFLFLFAILTVIYYRGFDPAILVLFGMPMMGALAFSESETRCFRWVATSFFFLVCLGVPIAKTDWLFPNLIFDDEFPTVPSRILAWYANIYLLYLFSVVPLVVFGHFLLEHRRGNRPGISRFTCILGFIAGLILTPFAIGSLFGVMGLWPIFDS